MQAPCLRIAAGGERLYESGNRGNRSGGMKLTYSRPAFVLAGNLSQHAGIMGPSLVIT